MRVRQLVFACAMAWLLSPELVGAQTLAPTATNALEPSATEPSAPASDAPPSPSRFDASTGAEAQSDEARGWDEAPGVEDEDVALFVPRALLFVPKLVLTAVFWLPEQGLKLANQHHLVEKTERILYFDEAHTMGWMPKLSYQSGYGPTGGAKIFHNSLFGHNEAMSLSGSYGGRYTQAYRLDFNSDRTGGSRLWLDLQGRYESQPGLLFGGIGIVANNASGSNVNPRDSNQLTYLGEDRALGLIRAGYTAGDRPVLVKLGGSAILNHRKFTGNSVDKRQLKSVYDTTLLPGFDDDVNTLELQANVIADLRQNGGLDTRGTYIEGFFGGVPELNRYAYLHYGFELVHTLDLYHATHLLRARAMLESVEGDLSRVPFTDLPRLGGVERLRGYREAQFRDAHASLAGIEYLYPIHQAVRGSLFVEAGYVAEHYGDLSKLDHWKVGYGGGLIIGSPKDVAVQFDVAYGDGLHFYLSTDLAQAFDGRSEQL